MACDGTGDEGGGGFADEEDGDPEAFCLGGIEEVSFPFSFFFRFADVLSGKRDLVLFRAEW